MARLGRLAGALLLQCDNPQEQGYYLVGDTKEPCKFPEHGFERPASLDGEPQPFVKLKVIGPVKMNDFYVELPASGEAGVKAIADRLLIVRNCSVSERMWRILTNPEQIEPPPTTSPVDGAWLMAMPLVVWNIVRDTVLRCV